MFRVIKVIPILALALAISGCTPVERAAYNTVVGAKAFLGSEKKAHPECTTQAVTSSSAICVDIARATAAKDTLIDALEVYCSGPAFETGGPCQPPKKGTPGYTQAQAKIQAAISNYTQIESDLKGLHQ